MADRDKKFHDSTGFLGLFLMLAVLIGMALLPGIIGLVLVMGDSGIF